MSDSKESPKPEPSEEEQRLAKEALSEFEQGHYEVCLRKISRLRDIRPEDAKLVLNQSVAEYSLSGFQETDKFIQSLKLVATKIGVNIERIESLDESDYCVLFFNYAVLQFHLKQYRTATAILDKIYHLMEPSDEAFFVRVCFLLTELYLASSQAERGIKILNYLEKGLSKAGDETEGATVQPVPEVYRGKISQYRCRCYMMLRSMKVCKREIKRLYEPNQTTSSAVFFKANFEYLRGNGVKALKILNMTPQGKSFLETGECLTTMLYNNYGCIHFALKKPHLGVFYVNKAYAENDHALLQLPKPQGQGLSGRPIQTLGLSKRYEILHNLGVLLLHCNKPLEAFECLVDCAQVYQTNPRLWLRLAECCIVVYKQSNEDMFRLNERLRCVVSHVGSNLHRKLLLSPCINKSLRSDGQSAAMPVATMEFAALCLRNALLRLPYISGNEDSAAVAAGEQRPSAENYVIAAPPSNPMKASEIQSLRCSVLAASAYVSLCLNDYVTALQFTDELLKQGKISPALRYLGNQYKAEALLYLDKVPEAVSQINPTAVTDMSRRITRQKDDDDKDGHEDPNEEVAPWFPGDVNKAKAVSHYNLAVINAIRGDLERASQHIQLAKSLFGSQWPAHLFHFMMYLQLVEGNRIGVQSFLKEHYGHTTPNRPPQKTPADWSRR